MNRRDERLRIRGSFGVQCICVYCVKSLLEIGEEEGGEEEETEESEKKSFYLGL